MNIANLALLHAPITAILRLALRQMHLSNVRVILDVACGPGLKSDWLAEIVLSDGQVVGVDLDVVALHTAQAAHERAPFTWIVGDALALPLAIDSVDMVWCVAALRLFADQAQALREMGRVTRPNGRIVVAVGEQAWVRPRVWPADLLTLLADAYGHHLRVGGQPLAPADGLGDGVYAQLTAAGFGGVQVRAFQLPEPTGTSQPERSAGWPDPSNAAHIHAAEIPLADWATMQAAVAPFLSTDDLLRCATCVAAEPEPELATVMLFATARA